MKTEKEIFDRIIEAYNLTGIITEYANDEELETCKIGLLTQDWLYCGIDLDDNGYYIKTQLSEGVILNILGTIKGKN